MGGKSSSTNDSVVNEQRAEAADAAAKEAARQARITKGLASIKTAFEGAPVTTSTSTPYDWSKFSPQFNPNSADPNNSYTGAPAGYTVTKVLKPSTPSKSSADYGVVANPNAGGGSGRGPIPQPTSGAGGASAAPQYAYALEGPDGKIYNQGDPLSITTQTPTGQTSGGFDDAFYNKYKQAVLDYYMPQVSDQYGKAKDELTYRLGRAGTLRSSAANTQVADLAKQNDINQAGVYNQADTAEGDLRTQVASERAKATSQLYATEDPDVAANQATEAVRNISLSQPNLSPLSSLFNIATVGGADILKGINQSKLYSQFNSSLPSSTSRNVS